MKQLTLDKILFQSYLRLILITALLISLFCAIIDVHNTLSNERKNMYDSLHQAQLNINTQTQMIEDYLTLTHSNASLQGNLKQLRYDTSTPLLTSINNELFSVDLFKKVLDSMQILIYDSASPLPSFSTANYHSNALFSAESVDKQHWFQETLKARGTTTWFIDYTSFNTPTLCAARVLYDIGDMPQVLGVVRANIPLDKITGHLSSLSFGQKGYSFILAEDIPLDTGTKIPSEISSLLTEENPDSAATHLIVKFPVITQNWQLVGIISNIELYKSTAQNLISIGLVSIFVILLATILSRKLGRKISSPVSHLCMKMQNMLTITGEHETNCIELEQLYDTYNEMLHKNQMLIKSRESTLIKYKQAEMLALQSQMNPHFIYNTLESINALIAMKENQNAALMTTELGNFLRNTLNKGNNLISLEKELAQVNSYVQIQKLRYSNKLELVMDVPAPLPDYHITKLILQPLVENCILHGFKDMDTTGIITISVHETESSLILSVKDNGLGTDIDMLNYLAEQKTLYKENNVNFYSIQNVYQRLENFYGTEFTFRYKENETGGVTACITISKKALITQKER